MALYIISLVRIAITSTCLHYSQSCIYSELCELIGLHSNNPDHLHPGPLDQSTTSILQCVLKVSERNAGDLLYHSSPKHECILYADDEIDNALLGRVIASGYASHPVYDRILDQQETKQQVVIGTITTSKVRKKEKRRMQLYPTALFNPHIAKSAVFCASLQSRQKMHPQFDVGSYHRGTSIHKSSNAFTTTPT